MEKNTLKIKNIINLEEFYDNSIEFSHLFEVQTPPKEIRLFKERFNFEIGNLLVGDLVLDLESERMLEIHPFPEWVIQLKTIPPSKSKPYLVVPNFSRSFMKKLGRKTFGLKIGLIKKEISSLDMENLIAFEYEEGINVLVPAFVPHFFISSKRNKEVGDLPPYLQVFEPNLLDIAKVLRIKPTYYFKLPFNVEI